MSLKVGGKIFPDRLLRFDMTAYKDHTSELRGNRDNQTSSFFNSTRVFFSSSLLFNKSLATMIFSRPY